MNEAALPSAPGALDGIGTLVYSVPVRVLEMSGGGCCVEAACSLTAGTAGQLRIQIDGVVHSDDFRVSRCQRREGAGGFYQLGIELLKTRRLTPRSVRLAILKLIDGCQPGVTCAREKGVPAVAQLRDARPKGVSRAPPTALIAPD